MAIWHEFWSNRVARERRDRSPRGGGGARLPRGSSALELSLWGDREGQWGLGEGFTIHVAHAQVGRHLLELPEPRLDDALEKICPEEPPRDPDSPVVLRLELRHT